MKNAFCYYCQKILFPNAKLSSICGACERKVRKELFDLKIDKLYIQGYFDRNKTRLID